MATFKERYEQWKQNQTRQEGGGEKTGTASFRERFNAWRRENRGQELSQDMNRRLAQWSGGYNALAKDYTERYAGRSQDMGTQAYVGDSADWYNGFFQKKRSLQAQTDDLLALLERDRGVFGDEWTDSVKQSLLEGQESYEDMLRSAWQDKRFWDGFTPTQEQTQAGQTAEELYGAWQTDYNYRKKYQGKTYGQVKTAMEALPDGEEKKWLETYGESIKTAGDYDDELAGIDARLGDLQTQYDRSYDGEVMPQALEAWYTDYITSAPGTRTDPEGDAKKLELYNALRGDFEQFGDVGAEIERLKDEKWRLENERQYRYLPENADFAEKSQVAHPDGLANYFDSLAGNADAHYDAVNDLYPVNPADEVRGRNPILAAALEPLQQNLVYMKEDERATYNYLYNTQGEESAEAYLEYLKNTLADRHSRYTVEEWSKLTKAAPLGANVASIATNLWSGVGYLDAAAQKITRDIQEKLTGEYAGPVNYNSAAMLPSKITSAVRETTARDITDKYGVIALDEEKHPVLSRMLNGKGLADVYQLGMSMVDSAAVAAMSPLVGSAGTLLLSGSAATQTMLDSVASGANDEQALMMGGMAGAFEYLFEKYELESLLNNGSQGALRALFNQSLSEGFGEGMTTVANLAADSLIMADKSELSRLTGEYLQKNPRWSETQARKEALKDLAIQVGWDTVGGVASGSVMGGGYAGINRTVEAIDAQRRQTAAGDVVLQTEGGVDALKALAMEVVDAANAKAQKQLRKLAEQMVDGKQNATRVGKLYGAVQKTVTAQNRADLIKSLEGQGFTSRRAVAIADALAAQQSGGELTSQQQKVLAEVEQDVRVQKTVADVLENEGSAYNTRNGEMAKFNLGILSRASAQEQTTSAAPVAAEEAAQAEIPAAETVSTADQDGKLVAEETFQRSTGEVVQVRKFTDFTDGKASVELANGKSAPAEDISFADSGDEVVFHFTASEENMTAPAANAIWWLWQNIKANKLPVSAERFASAAVASYRAGLRGDSTILGDQDTRAATLPKEQRELIYNAGRRAALAKADAPQANVDKVYAQANEALQQNGAPRKGTYRAVTAQGVEVSNMTRQQRAGFEMASLIAPGVKANIEMYNGGSELGYYDHNRDTICLNVNVKWTHTDMLTFTLGHELAHRAKLGSPAKFQAFADFLVKEYGKQGTDMDALIGEQLRIAEKQGLNMTEEEAFEEVVADACQRMLLNTDAGQKLAEFGAQSRDNRGILRDLKKWITEFMDRLRRIFRNVESDSLAAREFNRFDQSTKQILADMFVDMTMDAGEKLSTIREAGMTEKITTDRGGVKYKNAVEDGDDYIQRANLTEQEKQEGEEVANFIEQVNKMIDVARKSKRKKKIGVVSENHSRIINNIMQTINPEFSAEGYELWIDGTSAAHLEKRHGAKGKADRSMATKEAKMLIPWASQNATDGDFIYDDSGNIKLSDRFFNNDNSRAPEIRLEKQINGDTVYVSECVPDGVNKIVWITSAYIKKGSNGQLLNIEEKSSPQPTPEATFDSDATTSIVPTQSGPVKGKKAEDAFPHKLPGSREVADRGKLVDLFEQMVTNSNEYRVLENYRKDIEKMLALEEHLDRLSTEILRISLAEGPRNREYWEYRNKLKLQQTQAINRRNAYDNRLQSMEKSGVLKKMIRRYRKKITQESFARAVSYYQERNERRENEIRQYYRESRRKAVERHDMAEIRQRIRKDVQRLDSLLNKGTKNKNVKSGMQEFVGAALRVAKGTFQKNYDEYDMIRNGIYNRLNREQREVFDRCRELLKELDMLWVKLNPDSIHDKWDPEERMRLEDRQEALKKELAKNMAVLRAAGVFQTENESLEESTAKELIGELKNAYKALEGSPELHIQGAYSDEVYKQIEKAESHLAGKAIKDMTSIELRELQKMYRMVLHTITTSNDLFTQKRKADVRKLGEEVIAQLRTEGKEMTSEILDRLAKLGWANLKPETALELIGSETLTEMMQGLYRGEDTYARDIEHARRFAQEQDKKYGRKNWDLEQSLSFAGTQITLGQAMSLYAYTKRKQAQGHLEGDGFTHSSNVRIKEKKGKVPLELRYIMNATKTYKVTKEMYEQVAKLLTPEQRQYVDAMQEYLSAVMGAKGNEVSMKLYGIDLFEEKAYFPLKTAAEFRDTALAVANGDVKLKNSGFTHSTQDKAANPIVLDDFEKVWAAHVDKMSLYHGFVLPMEDFDRVYNYHRTEERDVTDAAGEVYRTELVDTNETVKIDIENKMGKAANDYIETFMRQLNGGVRGDPTEGLFGGLLKSFKKSAVMGSLSVAVQQPTAFIRAMAYLDMRDIADWRNWLGKSGKPEGKLVEEMYKYAPVALMKRIGGFDPNLGRSAENYIFGGSGVMEVVDTVTGWLPEHMDEWTWTYIWVCTKRQVHRQHPELRVGSEEFCQKAGERFSQIIRRTQVYDSVLTKSQIMRSQSIFLKMATAFMNEPTTSLDMYISAAIRAKQGKISKKQAARVYGAVVGSQILVAAISAFVYAARDDDEDETYWEKYMSSFVGKSIEGVLMLQSIPFVRDVVSIFDGYSSERSDMALIEDLAQGWKTLQSDNATPWEKVEAFGGSILNFFGIPAKNVSRDLRGIFRVVQNAFNSKAQKQTKAGMRYAVVAGLPFANKPSKTVQMENAVKGNDAEHILRLLGTYKTEDSANTAFRKAVKEVYLRGDVSAERATEFLQAYAGDDAGEAQEYLIKWDFKQKHAGTELSDAQILDWEDYAKPAGISLDTYTRFLEKAESGKKEDVLNVIDDLPISRKQKDALYLSRGYAESELDDAPWN